MKRRLPAHFIAGVSVFLGLMMLLASAGTAPEATPPAEPKEWIKLDISTPQFDSAKVGIHEVELSRIAQFLAIYVYREYSEKIWAGDTTARVNARRLLALALHLCPSSLEGRKVNEWLDGKVKQEQMPELPESPTLFAENVSRVTVELKTTGNAVSQRAAGFLALAAALIEPKHESVIYEAELFERKLTPEGVSLGWRQLHLGK